MDICNVPANSLCHFNLLYIFFTSTSFEFKWCMNFYYFYFFSVHSHIWVWVRIGYPWYLYTDVTHSLTHSSPLMCVLWWCKNKRNKMRKCKWHRITIQMGDDDEWIHLSFSISFHRLCISWMEKDVAVSYSNYFHIYGVFPVSVFFCRSLFTHSCHRHHTGTTRTAYLPFSPMSADCLANNAVSLLKERKNE